MAGEDFRSASKIARRLMLTPLVARSLENWPSFMYNYALGITPTAPYRFRSGARLRIARGVDHVPIIEVFLRQDYGEIPDGATIVDLGANIGAFSIYAATTTRNCRLYAYEPMPAYFDLMQRNVQLNGLEGVVECFNLAVAGDSDRRTLFDAGNGFHFPSLVAAAHQSERASTNVDCTTIADIIGSNALARIDVLKMDVEGAEYESLYGTPSNCFERIREIRMEYHELDAGRRNVRSLADFLKDRGYRIARQQATTPTGGNLWAVQHD